MVFRFRINTSIERQPDALLERFRAIPTPDISDAMGCSGTMDRSIGPILAEMPRIAGSAVTISLPTISMAVLKAGFEQAQTGDVIVINAMGVSKSAVVGGNMLRDLNRQGVAGLVIDGAMRDISEARDERFPVFATGLTTATGPEGPDAGEVNVPIACGRVVVNPGDIIVADEDGIVVIQPDVAEDVLAIVAERAARKAARSQESGNEPGGMANPASRKLGEMGWVVT